MKSGEDSRSFELEILKDQRLLEDEIHSVSSRSRLNPSSLAKQHIASIHYADSWLDDSTFTYQRASRTPNIRNIYNASGRALGYTKVKPWFEESDGPNKYRGWRKAVVAAAFLTALVLATNLILAIVAAAKYGSDTGVGVLYTGDCGVWALCLSTLPLHLFWNSTVFSTIGANRYDHLVVEESFLAGADYLTPVVQNYTNSEVSRADVIDPAIFLDGYRKGRYKRMEVEQCIFIYMSTFVTSYRNCIAVTTPRDGMRMSPGHMFPTFETNLSAWYGDMWTGFDGTYYSVSLPDGVFGYPQPLWNGSSVLAYQWFIGVNYTDVEEMNMNWPCIGWPAENDPLYTPTCDKQFVRDQLQQNGSWWLRPWDLQYYIQPDALEAYPIDYCLVEVQDVQQLLVVVIGCNIIKLACMSATAYYLWNQDEPIFATIGDAVSSYMERPDETTANWCLMDLATSKIWQNRKLGTDKQAVDARNVAVYQRKPTTRLFRATSKTRWWTTMSLCSLYLMVGVSLFSVAVTSQNGFVSSLSYVWSTYGLGVVTNNNLLDFWYASSPTTALLSSILFANSFQVVLSMTYFLFNSLWTAQCSAIEWTNYVAKRTPLRVTWPTGQQKSTYYLNLRYRYGVPLTVMLAILHFFISQSIYLARVQYWNPDGSISDTHISAVAYSPLGLLVVVCVASSLILALLGHSFRKIDNRIPVHGNSSAVISALCHTVKNRNESGQDVTADHSVHKLAELPVKWGVVRSPEFLFDFENDSTVNHRHRDVAGHCAFTADDVDPPEFGQTYR